MTISLSDESSPFPRVSVAVVTYNQVAYLAPCLDSILEQQYPNLQVVVADDGSTDGTRELLHRYAEASPGVFRLVLSHTNRGVTANSNAALEACDGVFIAWTGGDDLMLPGKLHKQVALLQRHEEAALCYHDLEVFDSRSGRRLRYFNRGPGSFRPRQGGAELLVEHGTFMGACSVMTRRSHCPQRFDPRVPVASDWLFWIETAMRGEILYSPEVLGRYRRHPESVTARSGSAAESFMTLAILEAEHPAFLRAVRRSRARHYYQLAVQSALGGRWRAVGQYLSAGARHGHPSRSTVEVGLRMMQSRLLRRRG